MTTGSADKTADIWLSPTTYAALPELRRWFDARPRTVRVVPDFLPRAEAADLRDALRTHDHWASSRHLLASDDASREATASEWAASGDEQRFSSHFVLRPLDALIPPRDRMAPALRTALIRFARAALIGPELRAWASAVAGRPLDGRIGCEITRYATGDFIAAHTDHYDGRSLGMVIGFDDCDATSGGVLALVDEGGRETVHPPRFNQAALIPIDPSCRHWVTPWARPEPGREGIALSFRAA